MRREKHRQTIKTSLDDFHLRFWFEVYDSGKKKMILEKMKRNCFLRLFSIVLALNTIHDGLMVNAGSASHKGMSIYEQ